MSPFTAPRATLMNGSREDLEKRLKAAEKVLHDMERALESTRKLIEETRLILDEAKRDRGSERPNKK